LSRLRKSVRKRGGSTTSCSPGGRSAWPTREQLGRGPPRNVLTLRQGPLRSAPRFFVSVSTPLYLHASSTLLTHHDFLRRRRPLVRSQRSSSVPLPSSSVLFRPLLSSSVLFRPLPHVHTDANSGELRLTRRSASSCSSSSQADHRASSCSSTYAP
jgi:hypothetical protein